MTDQQKPKWFLTRHAKSSAAMISLALHAVLILVALSFVAVTVIQKADQNFEAKTVSRPKMPPKKLQVPVKINKRKPPKLNKRIVVKNQLRKTPDIKAPEIIGIKGGMGAMGAMGGGLGDGVNIGFTMPDLDFFGAKAKGDTVVFVVHFGPDTINGAGSDEQGNSIGNPFTRMTGLVIRNRLADLVDELPEYILFNVICYWAGNAWAMEPTLQIANAENKQKVRDWMAPVNPLEGNYHHCFSGKSSKVNKAAQAYPTRVDDLQFYAPKWIYPYVVPKTIEQKYAPDAPSGFPHWGRGVAWAILEQKAKTIFVLTTNYDDGWYVRESKAGNTKVINPGQPRKMAQSLAKMSRDVYGPDKKEWPTINVVVLAKAGKDSTGANRILSETFDPIVKTFRSDGSIIHDIKKHMNKEEQALYRKYYNEYGNKQNNN